MTLSCHGSGTFVKCLVTAGYCPRRSGQVSEDDKWRKDMDAIAPSTSATCNGLVCSTVREAETQAFQKAQHRGNDEETE